MYCYIFSGVDQRSDTPTSQQYVQCNKDKIQAMETNRTNQRGSNNKEINN